MEQHPIKINKVQIRNLQIEDYVQLSQSFTRVYSDGSDVFWTREQIQKLIKIFPEGQIVTVVDDKIVGCALSIIVDYDKVKNDHTYAQVTGKETFNTHSSKGNILYGIEVFIHPGYRGLRLARRMYEYRKELCETLNLKASCLADVSRIIINMLTKCVRKNISNGYVNARFMIRYLLSSCRMTFTFVR